MISNATSMNPTPEQHDCHEVRIAIQLRHDGEPEEIESRLIKLHVDACDDCEAYQRDLGALRSMMRTIPPTPFPTEALEEVWANTVDRPVLDSPFTIVRKLGFSLAAAAVLMLSVIGAWFSQQPVNPSAEYTEAELVKLENDLEQVIFALGNALRESERLTINDVLIEEASPVLQVIPLHSDNSDTPEH